MRPLGGFDADIDAGGQWDRCPFRSRRGRRAYRRIWKRAARAAWKAEAIAEAVPVDEDQEDADAVLEEDVLPARFGYYPQGWA